MPRHDYFEDLKLGDKFQGPLMTVTDWHIKLFGILTNDTNPLHVSEQWCGNNSIFKKPVAHALLVLAMAGANAITPLVSLKMQEGGAHLGENWRFRAPAYVGDIITTDTEIAGLEPKKNFGMVRFKITVKNQDDRVIAEGETILGFPYEPKK